MIRTIKIFLVSIFLLIVSSLPIRAAVIINEISPSTDPEWVELFNDGDMDEDLTGFLLEDGNSSHSDDLNLTGVISKNGYLVFTHSEGWLNNGGDTLKLYNDASPSAIIDQYTFGSVDASKSIARSPNGSENWTVVSTTSNGSVNPNPTSTPTSTPTQTPTSTPILIRTPTPTPTKTPISTPTKTPTSTPTQSPVGSIVEQQSSESGNVLGIEDTTSSPSSSPKSNTFLALEDKNKIIAVIFIGLGTVLIGGSSYLAVKSSKSIKLQNDI